MTGTVGVAVLKGAREENTTEDGEICCSSLRKISSIAIECGLDLITFIGLLGFSPMSLPLFGL